ncbi:MAG: glycosyltransferase family 4 protein [Tannerella sp.]|jgi:glycosyltransferase involved in cell wall biosynthesis|nr:glycosyltransferase family 4 protein [Tannerella sp.]
MKIVVAGTRGIPDIQGGVETHCRELFPRIAARKGFDVTVIRRKSYTRDRLASYKGVALYDIRDIRRKSLEAIVHTFRAIWAARWKFNADIVHIHAIGPALLTPFARLLGMKVVFTHHGPDYDRAKWGKAARFMLRLGERMGCRFANGVIVISNPINDTIKRKYNRTDAHLIPNGVPAPVIIDDCSYLREIGVEPRKYIFAMGRFVPEKNFHVLIESFAGLNLPEYKLVIAGDADVEDAYSRALKQSAEKSGAVLTGIVKGDRLHALLTHARLFVLPSSHEGLPISLLEAMSYGLPVLASDIPANKALNLPPPCYFHYGGNIVENLARSLAAKLRDTSVPRYDMTPYDWDRIAEQTAAAYLELKIKN